MARSGAINLHEAASRLESQGLRVDFTHPSKAQARSPLTTRSISDPFLVVTSDAAEDGVDAVVVVDTTLREHLAVAPSTPSYRITLASDVPEVFVGTPARLFQLVTSMATAIQLNFGSQGIEIPPWRRKSALLSRWSVLGPMRSAQAQAQAAAGQPAQAHGTADLQAKEQAKEEALAQAYATAARQVFRPGAGLGPAQQTGAGPEPLATLVAADECGAANVWLQVELPRAQGAGDGPLAAAAAAADAGVALRMRQSVRDGQVHGGCAAFAAHPAKVVKGFQLGESAAGQRDAQQKERVSSAGRERRPGALASLCRAEAGGSSANSEEAMAMGASPLSVFRD
ncbi:hypothetical protein GPECTOR_1g333 [Gonium pectorale]|uniref:Uncharacterized protein n=1 Tax=Gonium pectorale TaxID=33097 RepID=A0A150H2H8_GONPE|nr:hypothetical protein GPECTOR_1g333 [Gonium pectorale]|eukprot:KXZ56376.1 hypothetical protein GPECTOR_1g333 [Gonium pectorale]